MGCCGDAKSAFRAQHVVSTLTGLALISTKAMDEQDEAPEAGSDDVRCDLEPPPLAPPSALWPEVSGGSYRHLSIITGLMLPTFGSLKERFEDRSHVRFSLPPFFAVPLLQ